MSHHQNLYIPPSNSTGSILTSPNKIGQNTVNFQTDFRCFDQDFYQNCYSFPKDIDKYWMEIGCPVSFIKIYDFILRIKDQELILSIIYNKISHPLASAFQKLHEYFCKIFNYQNLLSFLSLPKLNLRYFVPSLPEGSRCMFSSILALLRCILPKISSNEEQQKVLTLFSNWLVPESLKSKCKYDLSTGIILFMPISYNHKIYWIILRNDATITIVSFDGIYIVNNSSEYNIASSSESHLLIVDKKTFQFIDESHYQFFSEGLKESHPLISFVSSFKYASRFINSFPQILKKEFVSFLSNTDFILARAVFGQSPQIFNRSNSVPFYNCLIESGMFAPFIRYQFDADVKAINDPGTIFRGTTIATTTASNLLGFYGSGYVDRLINDISQTQNDPKASTRAVIDSLRHVPISMQFLFSCAFRSSRRKFPNTNTPLIAAGSLMTLRYIMPRMAQNSQFSSLSKHIMNAFLFRSDDQLINDQSLFDEITNLILTMVKMSDRSINFGNTDYSVIIKYMSDYNNDIIKKLRSILQEPTPETHPLCTSIMELIENAFLQPQFVQKNTIINTTYPQFSTHPQTSYLAQSSMTPLNKL